LTYACAPAAATATGRAMQHPDLFNIQMKHLQRTFKTDKTFETYR
jgi:hypothetical protein